MDLIGFVFIIVGLTTVFTWVLDRPRGLIEFPEDRDEDFPTYDFPEHW